MYASITGSGSIVSGRFSGMRVRAGIHPDGHVSRT